MSLTEEKIYQLKVIANEVRESIINMLLIAKSGHTAGPLGMADIFTYFYFHGLNHNPENPNLEERDYVVLSNGHICPVLYATMAHRGYMPKEELETLRKFGSRLQGHPHREFMPWLETSSGPLGSGFSQASGMALALKINKKNNYVYCFLGDGELNEGNNWEAFMFAAKYKLDNLVAIVDRNNIQIDGNTEDVMPLNDLHEKFKSFNFHVIEISGHDFRAIDEAVEQAKTITGKPTVIIANTIPGKGVIEFEKDYHWHGKAPNKEEAEIALNELRTLKGKIKSEHQ